MTHRHIRIGRLVLETLRTDQRDQWVDMQQSAEDPKLYEYFGDIERAELGDEVQYVNRNRQQHEKKIEQAIDAITSIAYIESKFRSPK